MVLELLDDARKRYRSGSRLQDQRRIAAEASARYKQPHLRPSTVDLPALLRSPTPNSGSAITIASDNTLTTTHSLWSESSVYGRKFASLGLFQGYPSSNTFSDTCTSLGKRTTLRRSMSFLRNTQSPAFPSALRRKAKFTESVPVKRTSAISLT